LSVAVQVGGGTARGIERRKRGVGAEHGIRDPGEAEVPIVPPQGRTAAQARKKDIGATIAVEIPGRDATAVEEQLIGEVARFRNEVRELEACGRGVQSDEARLATRDNLQGSRTNGTFPRKVRPDPEGNEQPNHETE
jgi:hypothetical protein